MKPLIPIFVIIASLIAVTIGVGQIKPTRNLSAASLGSFRLIGGYQLPARYDQKTGLTQILDAVSMPNGVKYQWKSIEEFAPLTNGATQYEVVVNGSGLTRMNNLGESWFTYSANGAVKWQPVQ